MICPKCRAEYRPGFTRCFDCGVPLVDSPPEPETAAPEPSVPTLHLNYDAGHQAEPVSIFRSIDPGRIALAKSILQSAGIPFAMSNERQQILGVSPFSNPAGPGLFGPVEIVVDRADADDARLLIQELEGTSIDVAGSEDEDDGHIDLVEPGSEPEPQQPGPESLPPQRPQPAGPDGDSPRHFSLVTVFASCDPGLLAIAKSLLQSAEIPCVVAGEGIADLFGFGRIGAYNPVTGPVVLQVAPQDADDARTLLADLGTADDVGAGDDVAHS